MLKERRFLIADRPIPRSGTFKWKCGFADGWVGDRKSPLLGARFFHSAVGHSIF